MKSHPFPILLACLALPLVARAQTPPPPEDPGMIVRRFLKQGSRAEFLKELKAAVAGNADKWYEKEFPSLISALEHEPPPPAGYDKPADKRSPDESIHAWIYDLRDDAAAGFPLPNSLDAMSRLVAAGPGALDALVAALDDDTPARQLGFEAGVSLAILLRRSDLALTCIERISGITFFRRTQGRGGYFHNDAQRASVADNVRVWWQLAQGKSQADGLRIQLKLWKQNTTLNSVGYGYLEADLLFTLAQLEPPDRVIGRLRELCAGDTYGLNSPITEGMLRVDPQFLLRCTFERLAANKARDGDYYLLLKYGDKKVYQELSRRAEIDNQLDPGSWTPGEQAQRAAMFGKNWAIPIVAAVLTKTEMTGSRYVAPDSYQRFCNADDAILPFGELTGKDFGYRKEASEANRLAAIQRAHDWWTSEGRTALADKIAADHPAVTDGTDLLATDDQIAATVARVAAPNAPAARAAVAALGKVYSFRTRQALLARLSIEADPAQRVLILRKLDQPAFWQAPALAAVFEKDASLEVRVAAGAALLTTFDLDSTLWARRLETRDTALAAVRRAADNPPPGLVLPALRILMRHAAPEDAPRIRALSAREPARSDPQVKKNVESLNTP